MFVPMMATVGWVITVVVADVNGEVGFLAEAEVIAKVTQNAIITEVGTILLADILANPEVLVQVEPY